MSWILFEIRVAVSFFLVLLFYRCVNPRTVFFIKIPSHLSPSSRTDQTTIDRQPERLVACRGEPGFPSSVWKRGNSWLRSEEHCEASLDLASSEQACDVATPQLHDQLPLRCPYINIWCANCRSVSSFSRHYCNRVWMLQGTFNRRSTLRSIKWRSYINFEINVSSFNTVSAITMVGILSTQKNVVHTFVRVRHVSVYIV